MSSDFPLILTWWAVLFVIGAAAYPITKRLFSSWWDQGYLFSKAVGMILVTYLVWFVGSWHILPFTQATIIGAIGVVFGAGILLNMRWKQKDVVFPWKKIIVLELFFFLSFFAWSFVKAHEPDIRGLEKFMDFGFAKTIYNSTYFPPPDMWYAGGTINYYYFGHTVMALLSKLSGIDLAYGYNLMLTTIFGLCFTMSFGIGAELFRQKIKAHNETTGEKKKHRILIGVTGLLAAFLVTLAGNMQTIYVFTKGYNGDETPPPFWNVLWKPSEFLAKFPEGMNKYWYANATRFIPFTIHEFPSYSFVVSDNHGHVLSIPFALLAIAGLLSIFGMGNKGDRGYWGKFGLFGGLIGILFMTNALDGPIYLGLFFFLFLFQHSTREVFSFSWMKEKALGLGLVFVSFIATTILFLLNFKSFANGLAINCPPAFLANTKIGPIIFETVDKCQKSPFWMMWLLWGFFWFCGIVLIVQKIRISFLRKSLEKHEKRTFWNVTWEFNPVEKFFIVLLFYCTGLLFFSEFFYFKDIYPQHFRSNTMFKLGYQSFMMLSLLSAYVIVSLYQKYKKTTKYRVFRLIFFILLVPQLFLIFIFPFFSVRSYFGELKTYKGLYGLSWFEREYPDDFQAMQWLSQTPFHQGSGGQEGSRAQGNFLKNLAKKDSHVKDTFFTDHLNSFPVIVEADGDSYTDYDRMSAFAGMPTIIGWGVHEWLWRGSYDIVLPRKDEVKQIYETDNQLKRVDMLHKYNVRYIVVGTLERKKFIDLKENLINQVGTEVFRSGTTVIYSVNI